MKLDKLIIIFFSLTLSSFALGLCGNYISGNLGNSGITGNLANSQ